MRLRTKSASDFGAEPSSRPDAIDDLPFANALWGDTPATTQAAMHVPVFVLQDVARLAAELSDGSAASGPEAAASSRGKGGKGGTDTSGGTDTGGTGGSDTGGTTGGTDTGGTGDTSGGGTGGTGTTTPPTSPDFLWPTLAPPTGDSTLPTDTYFYKQWNLTSKTAGINVATAWQNYTGTGVKIGVIDDGIDYKHTDLDQNYLFSLDYDALLKTNDAFGTSTGSHGTTVAGVIAGERDGSGIVGVAYNADIAGFRIGYGSSGSPSQIADAFNHVLASDMDIANASWSYTTAFADNFYSSGFSAVKTALVNDVAQGREGLGISIVASAGNARSMGDNTNYHNLQNSPHVITVAGTNLYGQVTSYSSPGASILVAAPSSAYTDDRVGSAGSSIGDYIPVSGTSYSAPVVSGVIALMLQANPNLGYRDVMEILAYSAKNSDPASTSWQTNGADNWNGGGLHFSHDYGFGLVDATAAVRLAESWMLQSTYANLMTQTVSVATNAKIPDGIGSLTSQVTLTTSELLDKVVVGLNISHACPKDLTVTLTSPSGTTAVLVANPSNGTGTGIVFETSANTFWGEDAKGTWTLTVTDKVSGTAGTLNSWTLSALGDRADGPSVYVYTNEFATAAGVERSLLQDTTGPVIINTAAVTTAVTLDLHSGAISTIAGRALQIASDTAVNFAWTGDGNDIIIANDNGNTIQAGRGNDLVYSGLGADLLYGGLGCDRFVFKSFAGSTDRIEDYTDGQDVIDLSQLVQSLGYNGINPLADGWLSLMGSDHNSTFIVVDAHNGTGSVAVVEILGVTTSQLQAGVDYLWTV